MKFLTRSEVHVDQVLWSNVRDLRSTTDRPLTFDRSFWDEATSFLLLVIMPFVPSSFLLLLVRHLLLEAMHLFLLASCY